MTGYIRVVVFSQNAAADVQHAVQELTLHVRQYHAGMTACLTAASVLAVLGTQAFVTTAQQPSRLCGMTAVHEWCLFIMLLMASMLVVRNSMGICMQHEPG